MKKAEENENYWLRTNFASGHEGVSPGNWTTPSPEPF
jgi:hypothetical protein